MKNRVLVLTVMKRYCKNYSVITSIEISINRLCTDAILKHVLMCLFDLDLLTKRHGNANQSEKVQKLLTTRTHAARPSSNTILIAVRTSAIIGNSEYCIHDDIVEYEVLLL